MFRIHKISSFDLPELQPYATLRRPLEHEQQGIFVAESEKVVRRLLESRLTVVSVVMPEKWLESFRPLLEARTENFTVYLADKKLLENLVGFTMFQGVLAVGKTPAPVSLEEMLTGSPSPKLFVAVDELANAENLGALVRNCVAFGVQALIVGETSSSPYLRRAVRNSMGTIFQLPVIELAKLGQRHQFTAKPHAINLTLTECLKELRQCGVHCVAAHPHAESWSSSFSLSGEGAAASENKLKLELQHKTISRTNFTSDCCLILGSEGKGISRPVLEACNETVAIPMPPTVDSLNVGAAAAVFLYEAARQRQRI